MNFKYLAKVTQEEDIEVENIGNCVIDAYNNLAFEWLLIINTVAGKTEIIEYGPIIADVETYLPASVSYTYNKIDFSESKIIKRISSFLNDGYRNITQAFEIDIKEAKSKIKNMVEFLEEHDD